MKNEKMTPYNKYKPSGIGWIGEIPEHWEVKKISYCFKTIGSGTTPTAGKNEYYENGEFNWLQTGDLNDSIIKETSKKVTQKALDTFSTLRIYPPNSLVIAMYGATIGKIGLLDIETSTNQACCVLSSPLGLDVDFVFYWLIYVKPYLLSLSYGGGQPNISQEDIRNLRIQKPPIQEQTAIANYLDQETSRIDRLIEYKQQLIELYEEEKTAIINQAVTKGINPQVQLKDSGIEWLGQIPEHWEVKKLKYLADLKSGKNIVSEQIKEIGEFPVFGGNGLRGFFSEYTHDGNYILVGRQGAYCGNIKYGFGKFWASEHAVVLTPVTNYEVNYLGELLRSMNLGQYSVSAAQPGLAVEVIKNLLVCAPPLSEQQSIVNHIETQCAIVDSKIAIARRQIKLYQEYKQALISEVVTGRVKVI